MDREKQAGAAASAEHMEVRCRPVRRLAIVRLASQIHPDLSSFYLYLTDQLGKVMGTPLLIWRAPMHVSVCITGMR